MVEYVKRDIPVALKHALLAGLELESRSGYDLARWFRTVAGHYWAASHSSIYPTLAEMEREGLVAHTIVPSVRGPARKVYQVTRDGRTALVAWVETPAAEMEVRDEQLVKALCYGLISPERALALLRGAKTGYSEKLEQYEQIARWLEAAETADSAPTPAARLGMLLTLRCGIQVTRGYVAWCDEAAALIEAQAAGSL